MTRWCRPDRVMQQSGASEVHILIENLYKFEVFGGKMLIPKLPDKSWNVRSLNKLLKKLRHCGSKTR